MISIAICGLLMRGQEFRAVSLDVARRYHSLSTIRYLIRVCELADVPFVQLHLTDDQNWMVPTPSTEGVATLNQHGLPAYTRDELVGLQRFAKQHNVTLVPEVDLPGHNSLLCRWQPARFGLKGSSNCLNFASRAVRQFSRGLIAEVADLFPESPYIHIGGDEAYFGDAEHDSSFTALAPSTPEQVFVDYIGELCEEVLKEGKTPIVWEGFRRADFAKERIPKETLVVAWEGDYYPANELVKDGFRVVNGGWDPYYVVGHFPYDSYTLAPLPSLYSRDENRFGVFNWTGGSPKGVIIPGGFSGSLLCWWEGREWSARETLPLRLFAFGRPFGSIPYDQFLSQSRAKLARLDRQVFPFQVRFDGLIAPNRMEFENICRVQVSPSKRGDRIGIRMDGGQPTLFDVRPEVSVSKSSVVTIQAFRDGRPEGEMQMISLSKVTFQPNLALGKSVTSSVAVDPQFPPSLVTDGVSDRVGGFWLGYPIPASVTVDLGKPTEINRVEVVPFFAAGAGTSYTVSVATAKNDFEDVAQQPATSPAPDGFRHRFAPRSVRFIRVTVNSSEQYPPSMGRLNEIRAFLDR